MQFKEIFLTRHSELRSGWKVLLFLIILSGVSLTILLSLQLPGLSNAYTQSTGFLLAALISTYIMTRYINHKPFSAAGLGLRAEMFRELGMGTLLGFLMMAGIFIIQYGLGYVHLETRGISLWESLRIVGLGVLFFAPAAMAEEVLFRGYVFQTLIQGITFLPSVVVMACFFAIAHAGNPNVSILSFVNIGLAAVWLSFAYFKTRSLWLPFGLHFGWNFSQTTIFSFPTSGIEFEDGKLFLLTRSGPQWLTGGEFGPEGGILATLALFICTWYILKSKYLTAPEGIITLDSVEDLLGPGDEGDSEEERGK